jgi:DNA modification methylase
VRDRSKSLNPNSKAKAISGRKLNPTTCARDPKPLEIEYINLSQLRPDPNNPRRHSSKQIQQIANSVRAFGWNVPLSIDEDGKVITGHGRLEAAKVLGLKAIPAIRLEHLSPAQRMAFALADNKLTENSTWDDQLVGERFKSFAEGELDFNLEDTGFETSEIDMRIESLESAPASEPDPADELPEPGQPITQPGDAWRLGKHQVFCGNALLSSTYSELLGNRRAAAVFADPPYNVPIDGHASGLGKKRHRDFAMGCGEMTESEFTDFLCTTCRHSANHSLDGSLHYLCMDWRHMGEVLKAGSEVYDELKNVCVWAKDVAGMGSFYRSQHEMVFVFKHGKASHRNNIQLGQFGRYRTNLWRYPAANSFSRSSAEGNLLALHPTVKPAAMVADAIMDCTARGDIVLDPFLGSGTTIVAAERTGRICLGIEIDPIYVDTAIRRWQRFTGLKAIHFESGRNFAEIEEASEDNDEQSE